jgi:hypothetical protein
LIQIKKWSATRCGALPQAKAAFECVGMWNRLGSPIGMQALTCKNSLESYELAQIKNVGRYLQ